MIKIEAVGFIRVKEAILAVSFIGFNYALVWSGVGQKHLSLA